MALYKSSSRSFWGRLLHNIVTTQPRSSQRLVVMSDRTAAIGFTLVVLVFVGQALSQKDQAEPSLSCSIYEFCRNIVRTCQRSASSGRNLAQQDEDEGDDGNKAEEDRTIMQHRGSCHCKSVKFEFPGPRTLRVISESEKIHALWTRIPSINLDLQVGNEFLKTYHVEESDGLTVHTFCSRCGVHLSRGRNSVRGEIDINANCLESGWIKMRIFDLYSDDVASEPSSSERSSLTPDEPLDTLAEQYHPSSPVARSPVAASGASQISHPSTLSSTYSYRNEDSGWHLRDPSRTSEPYSTNSSLQAFERLSAERAASSTTERIVTSTDWPTDSDSATSSKLMKGSQLGITSVDSFESTGKSEPSAENLRKYMSKHLKPSS